MQSFLPQYPALLLRESNKLNGSKIDEFACNIFCSKKLYRYSPAERESDFSSFAEAMLSAAKSGFRRISPDLIRDESLFLLLNR